MRSLYVGLILLVALPVPLGFISTLLPSFYYFPTLKEYGFSLQAYKDLFAYSGIFKSVVLTLTIGWGAVLLSFGSAIVLSMGLWDRQKKRRAGRGGGEGLLSLFLSVPHSAFAIGLLFLLIPNGWLLRLLSPWLTGFSRPPIDWSIPDLYGITALLGLSLKEVPFLLLVFMTAVRQFPAQDYYRTALCLGYSPHQAFFKAVLPHIYKRSRLSLFAVLAYSLSVVDVALILSPSPVPVLSVHVLRWSLETDTSYYFLASAAAILQLGVIVFSFLIWILGEKIAVIIYHRSIFSGTRKSMGEFFWTPLQRCLKLSFIITCAGAIVSLPLFSFSHRWRFPEPFPNDFSFMHWQNSMADLPLAFFNSLSLGLLAALFGLVIAIALLEIQSHNKSSVFAMRKILFLPLLLPQVAFLLGVQMILLQLSLPIFISVLLCHLLFTVPYILLVLSDSYMNYERQASVVGKTLGRSPWVVFVKIKLGLLFPALCFAFAVGFAVSIGQYLPTIFASAGRFGTLTTEAVTLASGGNRGSVAVYAVWQSMLPLTVFWLSTRGVGRQQA